MPLVLQLNSNKYFFCILLTFSPTCRFCVLRYDIWQKVYTVRDAFTL